MYSSPTLNGTTAAQKFIGTDTYEVIATIYEDPLYVTYLATARATGQRFMLRTLNGHQGDFHVNSLRRAASTLSNLSSPHIVKIHDVGNTPNNDNIFIAMEPIEGLPLPLWIEDMEISEFVALRFLRQLALALKELELHVKPHGSIQPSSIFVCPNASNREETLLKIWDLGLAKVGDSGIAFEAPERVSDISAPLTIRADIYSIGAVIYRLLTDRAPYEAQSAGQLALQVSGANSHPVSLASLRSDLSADSVQLIERCMAKNPNHRYQSTSELIGAIERLLGGHDDRMGYLLRQAQASTNQSDWLEVLRIYESAKGLNGGASGKRQIKTLATKAERLLTEAATHEIKAAADQAINLVNDLQLRAAKEQLTFARKQLALVEKYVENSALEEQLQNAEDFLKQQERFKPAYLVSKANQREYSLDRPLMMVGRSHGDYAIPDNGLDLCDEPRGGTVTRRGHAELLFIDGVWKVRHGRNPHNTTRVDGIVVPLYEPVPIQNQQLVEFGQVALIFHLRE